MSIEIPVPITFNPYKHHFRFLLEETEKWKAKNWTMVEKDLRSIGNNLIDFYVGDLSIIQICKESLDYFKRENITRKNEFSNWLNASAYKRIKLSDNSEWLVKEGINPNRYIHIHPAKYSQHTIRVRATTLKTVIALNVQSVPFQKEINTNLFAVNNIRMIMLGLSPIKSLTPGAGILRIWKLFDEEIKRATIKQISPDKV